MTTNGAHGEGYGPSDVGLKALSPHGSGGYWDRVATSESATHAPLWRRQSDLVNTMLLDRWLPAMSGGRVLKTDLFDELVTPGLQPALRARGARVVGIDISPVAVAAAAARHPDLESVVADVRNLPFKDGSFAAVVSNSTLDHFTGGEEVAAALSELSRVLRPGGRLILTMDNPLNPLIALRNGLPAAASRALRNVSYGTGWTCGPVRLRRMVAANDLEVLGVSAIMHLPRVLLAGVGRRRRSARTDSRWLSLVRTGETLERLPTRFLTGHFLAVLAVRPA